MERCSVELSFEHVSVLPEETLAALVQKKNGIYVDCTLGGSGHAARVAGMLEKEGMLIGIDQDPAAIAVGRERLKDMSCKIELVQRNFRHLGKILDELGVEHIDGVLFDLGVSSHQLDTAERGFSYMQDAPLDMRMDTTASLSAYEVVNRYEENDLAEVIFSYGEERWAKRIAAFICRQRAEKTIETTGELVEIIKKAIPAAARRDGPHPAKRTFQAIRIEVNSELSILKETFFTAVERLAPGGRICIITFHSLEDRIAKQTLQALAKGCQCPPRIPICVCGKSSQVRLIGKAIAPGAAELEANPRARSAKLRVAEKRF